jgi:hypothetical protein
MILIALVALLVGSVGFRDEGYAEVGGDEPKYLMNGVFFLDVARDAPRSLQNLPEYARQYYARYPALSLGHHPLLPSLAAVPAYAVFGISLRSARLVPLVSFVAATLLFFLLIARMFEWWTATIATLIVVLSPMAAWFSRILSSEMPAIAAVLAAAYFADRYARDGRASDLWLFTLSGVTCIWAKQISAVVLPVFVIYMVWHRGLRVLIRREVLICGVAGAVLAAPMVAITRRFSAQDLHWFGAVAAQRTEVNYSWLMVQAVVSQLSWPLLLLAAAGLVITALRRDARGLLFIGWTASYALLVILLTKNVETTRFTVYWTPAIAVFAALAVTSWKNPVLRAVALLVALLMMGDETLAASKLHLGDASGYEVAARYVVEQTKGPGTVLFSGPRDTGYVSFFTRKHDPNRRIVVLRSDKLIHSDRDLQATLREFGTQFVILEDHPAFTPALESLRTDVVRAPFVERLRVPCVMGSELDSDLLVMENPEAPAPDPNARLLLNVPLAGMKIDMRLGDLLDGPTVMQKSESRLK